MAEVTVTDPQNGNSAALNVGTQTPATSKGSDGNGVHVDSAALSAGLTDEANMFAIVELSKIGKQHLETTEDIKVKTFTVDELEKKIQNSELELTVTGYLGCVLLINKIKANK